MSWWGTGFPDPEPATLRQKSFIKFRYHDIVGLLSDVERMGVQLMDPQAWVDSLSKQDASGMIQRVKVLEEGRGIQNWTSEKSFEEATGNQCVFFTGILAEECEAKVPYRDVIVKVDGEPPHLPCLKNRCEGTRCKKRAFPSAEDVVSMVDAWKKRKAEMALKDVIQKEKARPLSCPKCGRPLEQSGSMFKCPQGCVTGFACKRGR